MEKISITKIWMDPDSEIRASGRVVALLLSVVGLVYLVRGFGWSLAGWWWLAAGIVFVLFTFFPVAMRPVYFIYMLLAGILGIVVPTLLLTVIYLTMFTLTGMFRRFSTPLRKGFDVSKESYWEKKVYRQDRDSYYRQY